MSGIHLVASGTDLKNQKVSFSDLIRDLKSSLEHSQTLPDLEGQMKRLATYLKDPVFTPEQKRGLKSLRQKGYDKRSKLRKIESENLGLNFSEIKKSEGDLSDINSDPEVSIDPSPVVENQTKVQEMKSNFNEKNRFFVNPRWDGLLKYLPQMLLLLLVSIVVGWLLWNQSVDLYKASGFTNPEHIAFGGVIMIVAFAGFHSMWPSTLAKMLCLYISLYEVFFIYTGTVAHERNNKISNTLLSTEEKIIDEQLTRAKEEYDRQRERYKNPSSKEYKSVWFKNNYLDPAWKRLVDVKEKSKSQIVEIKKATELNSIGWLKIFYRLGLVFLSMLVTHRLFEIILILRKVQIV